MSAENFGEVRVVADAISEACAGRSPWIDCSRAAIDALDTYRAGHDGMLDDELVDAVARQSWDAIEREDGGAPEARGTGSMWDSIDDEWRESARVHARHVIATYLKQLAQRKPAGVA